MSSPETPKHLFYFLHDFTVTFLQTLTLAKVNYQQLMLRTRLHVYMYLEVPKRTKTYPTFYIPSEKKKDKTVPILSLAQPNGFQPYYILSSFTVHYCNVTVKVTLKDNVTYFLIFELGKKKIDSTYPKYINTTLGPGPHTWNSTVSRFVSCRLFFFFYKEPNITQRTMCQLT